MRVGQTASTTRRYGRDEIRDFGILSGSSTDDLDHVPEPLLAGLVSRLLGVDLPGAGTNYLKQSLEFHGPAPIGVDLTAMVEITRLRPEKHLCDLATTLTDPSGRVIATGRALVYVEDVPGSPEVAT